MNKKLQNIAIGILLSLFSITFFFLAAEGLTRLYDNYFADTKIEISYDDRSRLEGYTLGKKGGVFRILALGDSITYGQGVKREETFSKVLEGMLNENNSKRVEIVNTGIRGLLSYIELAVLLGFPQEEIHKLYLSISNPDEALLAPSPNPYSKKLPYEPDMILLQYTVTNDADSPNDVIIGRIIAIDRDGHGRNSGEYSIPLPESVDRWLNYNSKFYLFFLMKYHGFLTKLGLRDEIGNIRTKYSPGAIGWINAKYAIKRIGQIARSYDIPAVMVIWGGGPAGVIEGNPLGDIHKLVGSVAKGNGFHVLDLADIDWPNENFSVSMVDNHPNAKAHKITAEAIYNFLKGERLVPE